MTDAALVSIYFHMPIGQLLDTKLRLLTAAGDPRTSNVESVTRWLDLVEDELRRRTLGPIAELKPEPVMIGSLTVGWIKQVRDGIEAYAADGSLIRLIGIGAGARARAILAVKQAYLRQIERTAA